MPTLPEGVHGYPRWKGALSQRSSVAVVAADEVALAVRGFWVQIALALAFAYALFSIGNLSTASRGGAGTHTMDGFLFFLNFLRWAPLVVAGVLAGPMLLEDKRYGALELYLSRAVTRLEYLLGKTLSVVGLSFLALVGPALVYYLATLLLFPTHPEPWAWVPLGILAYGLMWAAMVTGLGLGLSCIVKGSRGATLILLGSFAALDVFTNNVYAGNQRLVDVLVPGGSAQILSPMNALAQQSEWLFGTPGEFAFPLEWGLGLWAALTAAGWLLVAFRHPRLGGVE